MTELVPDSLFIPISRELFDQVQGVWRGPFYMKLLPTHDELFADMLITRELVDAEDDDAE